MGIENQHGIIEQHNLKLFGFTSNQEIKSHFKIHSCIYLAKAHFKKDQYCEKVISESNSNQINIDFKIVLRLLLYYQRPAFKSAISTQQNYHQR